MTCLIASEARKKLYSLIDEIATSHELVTIKGKRNAAILVSLDDWENIQETLLVASNKKLSESILEGLNTPYEECTTTLD